MENTKNIRLNKEYLKTIKELARKYFNAKEVRIFGSRADMNKRGGDIDIYIETTKNEKIIELKLKMLGELQDKLGEQKFDIIINNFQEENLIFDIARKNGILL